MHERIYRKDYRVSDFLIDSVDLDFDLSPEATRVRTTMRVRRNPASETGTGDLALHGDELELLSVRLDGASLDPDRFRVDSQGLRVLSVPDRFELETEVLVRPAENSKLMGLYTSSGTFCTQCEAEGFRRITYYLDRPDVMARFTTRIEADRSCYPVLLSNGNRVGAGELPKGRHWVRWEDPFPKPSYLFALVAGDLHCHRGSFTTASGREVALEIWVEHSNADKCEHALASLRSAMKWDEDTYGLEYDLDIYMIVAVDDFNMGAMENKGLNVFNSKYVLAKPSTATDDDYEAIEGVIAHEYFHNWTGNRVTCRDWFQLTLKEGLTVFRDQEFSADMTSRPVQRIKDVTRLRNAQFAEDAGPLAHPIRPESYIEMNNFYTATVYEKGAEVVRLYQTLFGRDGFRKGLRRYLETNDGLAVTCDDFRQAMASANGADLQRLERWYSQAGTPAVAAKGDWDESTQTYTLAFSQSQRAIAEADEPKPLPIPIRVGLLGADGNDLEGTARTLQLEEAEQSFSFEGIRACPIPSIGRGFSAPIKLQMERSHDELAFLMANDSDPFNRWEAGQRLAMGILLGLVDRAASDQPLELHAALVPAFRKVLHDPSLDGSIKAMTLQLPSEELIAQELSAVDPDTVHRARDFVVRELGAQLRDDWMSVYAQHARGSDALDKTQIDRRRMKNRALQYLAALGEPDTTALAAEQFAAATGMTDYEAAFRCLVDLDGPETDRATDSFYQRWQSEPLVLDKWFRIQAMSNAPSAFDRAVALSGHPAFTLANPNRARSLLYAFAAGNPVAFHRPDGKGHGFVAEQVLRLDGINPQVASRIVSCFNQWRRYESTRRESMKSELERIARAPGISKDVSEIVDRALES
ncbi:MAG: aminopeptidase N [Polyangiales bacterium]